MVARGKNIVAPEPQIQLYFGKFYRAVLKRSGFCQNVVFVRFMTLGENPKPIYFVNTFQCLFTILFT